MGKKAKKGIAVPAEIREIAEFAVDEADRFAHGLLDTEQQVIDAIETDFKVAHDGVRAVVTKMMAISANNVTAFFEHCHRLVGAHDIPEMLELQSDFARQQYGRLTSELQDFAQTIEKASLAPFSGGLVDPSEYAPAPIADPVNG